MKLFHASIFTLMVLMGISLSVFGYWSLEGTFFHKVLNKDEIIFTTTQQVYRPGDTVEGTFSLCKYTLDAPVVQWSLVDTYLRIYPAEVRSTREKKCYTNLTAIVEKLPIMLGTGTYHFSGTAIYKINPIKTIIVDLKTNEFQVKNTPQVDGLFKKGE